MWQFLHETLPSIAGPLLISAYDVAHQPRPCAVGVMEAVAANAPSFVLLDSGGYELLWNVKAVSAGLMKDGAAPDWSIRRYHAVLDAWPADVPVLAVSYDEPPLDDDAPGPGIDEQIQSARSLAARHPGRPVELLLKPSNGGFDAAEIADAAEALADFPAIGFTEDEIGQSMAQRLGFIAAVREGFDRRGVDLPIHIFGGLDPRMTPLYHAAGADIFDGLSWLRYAFDAGVGVYDKSHVAVRHPRANEADEIWAMRRRNVAGLVDLQIGLTRFQADRDFAAYGPLGDQLSASWEACWQEA